MCSVGVSTMSHGCATTRTDVLSEVCPKGTLASIARNTRKVISMSTATAHYVSVPLPTNARLRDGSGRSGRLRLVGDLEPGRELDHVAGREPLPERSHAVRRSAVERVHLRLTRRGRLALTGMVAVLIALVAGSMVSMMGPAGATSAVVVEPGMTLTQIAAEQLPELPLSQAITDIQRANSLSTTSIAVGQELVIPGR